MALLRRGLANSFAFIFSFILQHFYGYKWKLARSLLMPRYTHNYLF